MSPDEIKLRGQMRVLANWIIDALKVLDTIDPDETTEAEALHKLIRDGKLLGLGGLAAASCIVQPDAQPAASPHLKEMAAAVLRQLSEPFPREDVDLDAVGLLCRAIAGGYVEGAAQAAQPAVTPEQRSALLRGLNTGKIEPAAQPAGPWETQREAESHSCALKQAGAIDPGLAVRLADGLSGLGTMSTRLRHLYDESAAMLRAIAAQPAPQPLSEAANAALAEVEKATRKFPTWPTDPLHALAVLGEEFGELTKDVLQMVYEPHKTNRDRIRTECVQTAAMALRFMASLDRYEYRPGEQHSQGGITAAPTTDTTKD